MRLAIQVSVTSRVKQLTSSRERFSRFPDFFGAMVGVSGGLRGCDIGSETAEILVCVNVDVAQ